MVAGNITTQPRLGSWAMLTSIFYLMSRILEDSNLNTAAVAVAVAVAVLVAVQWLLRWNLRFYCGGY